MWKKTKHTFEKEVIMIVINIDVMLAKRKMSVTQLSEKVGISGEYVCPQKRKG